MRTATTGVIRRRAPVLALAALALVAASLRVAHQRQLWRGDVLARVPAGDERTFATIARRVAQGQDDQVPYQAPLYPTLLGGLERALGLPPDPVLLAATRALQALLGLGAAAIAAVLAARLTGERRAAVVAFGLTALARPLVHAEGTLLREAGSTTLLAALSLAYAKALEGAPSLERHAALGLALGLGLVLRENFAVVAGAVLVERAVALARRALAARAPVAGSSGPPSREARGAALVAAVGLVLGVALPLLPFDAKVARLGDGVHVLPHWNSGCVFYLANRRDNPSVTGYGPPAFVPIGNPEGEQAGFRAEAERRTGHALGPHEVSRFWLREGLSEVAAAPGVFASRVVQRLVASLAPWEMAHQRDPDVDARFSWVLRAPLPGLGALLVLAALGLGTALFGKRLPGERALWVVLGAWWISLVAAAFTTRYRVPAIPLLAVAGARGLVGLAQLVRARERWRRNGSLVFSALVAALVLVVLPARRMPGEPANALHTRGLAALEAGDVPAAAAFLDEASSLRGDRDPALLLLLGEAWLRLNQPRRAWAAYALVAAGHGPAGDEVRRGLALALVQLGRPREALSDLETLAARAPGDQGLARLLALARSAAERGPDAPFPAGARDDPRTLLR